MREELVISFYMLLVFQGHATKSLPLRMVLWYLTDVKCKQSFHVGCCYKEGYRDLMDCMNFKMGKFH